MRKKEEYHNQLLEEKQRELELAAMEMERKEASFKKQLEEQRIFKEREEKREQ